MIRLKNIAAFCAALAVCVTTSTIHAAGGVGQTSRRPRPSEILRDVQAVGARATLNELYRDDEKWTTLLRGIAGGTAEWFAVAEALRPAADAHPAEALESAVGEALRTNAQMVLSHAAGPFFLAAVCKSPDVDDERFDSLRTAVAELNRRVRGVERVEDPALAQVRTDCLNALRGSETELRRYFEKHEELARRIGAVWKSVTWHRSTRI